MSDLARRLYRPITMGTPRGLQVLLTDPRSGWLWLVARLYLGYQWLESGRHKLQDDSWMENGIALRSFWERAIAVPQQGRPPITYGWYRDFLQYMLDHTWYEWFAKVIAIGETAIGVALILGAFVGVAAFCGAFLNFNFMLAGSASTNPLLFTIAILLMLGWRVAGHLGLDRWLLSALGTPWQPGYVFKEEPPG